MGLMNEMHVVSSTYTFFSLLCVFQAQSCMQRKRNEMLLKTFAFMPKIEAKLLFFCLCGGKSNGVLHSVRKWPFFEVSVAS